MREAQLQKEKALANGHLIVNGEAAMYLGIVSARIYLIVSADRSEVTFFVSSRNRAGRLLDAAPLVHAKYIVVPINDLVLRLLRFKNHGISWTAFGALFHRAAYEFSLAGKWRQIRQVYLIAQFLQTMVFIAVERIRLLTISRRRRLST